MRPLPLLLASLGSASLLAACAADRTATGPDGAAASAAVGAGQTAVSGTFDANVDFRTITLTPTGENCRLVVNGQLVFHGSIDGTATGTTSALVFAPCEEVASKPPGSDADVFQSRLVFDGTVNGETAHGRVLYTGSVEPGGHITGKLIFSDGIAGELDADAVVAVGGTYDGTIVVP